MLECVLGIWYSVQDIINFGAARYNHKDDVFCCRFDLDLSLLDCKLIQEIVVELTLFEMSNHRKGDNPQLFLLDFVTSEILDSLL